MLLVKDLKMSSMTTTSIPYMQKLEEKLGALRRIKSPPPMDFPEALQITVTQIITHTPREGQEQCSNCVINKQCSHHVKETDCKVIMQLIITLRDSI